MTKIALLLGAAVFALPASPVSAAPEPARTTVASPGCDEQPCAARKPATCIVDASRGVIANCQHSAAAMEELGRRQLDLLIADMN
ncbi:hypothetical protein [Sphingomonas sp. CCH5-D11]|uniref:hypothetical protein n=1 Tax=Sphingomonas sp. CCH5-D11 TaxID=1768786 RepID=UPI0008297C98|nr:hypothetical protein [Sphingomonas sp. CCH5-D11]